ncbi:MAG TPA: nitronate monooxygenase [Xanthomonadales bacterium]|nr:nitronate monooxygenase [Xanthomonadales bacterium]
MTGFLGAQLPIVQAPMAGVQGAALAIAACNAGALGSLPAAMLAQDVLRAELERIRAATAQPLNVNFFCHAPPAPDAVRESLWRALLAPYYAELGVDPDAASNAPARRPFDADAAAIVEAFRPAVVSFHFGLPEAALLARVRATGAKVLSSATTLAEALWLERHGVDAVIAQGSEAGGHRGTFLAGSPDTQVGTFALVRQCVRALRVPVVAAGGIADAAGVAAAFALGAAAVQVGTAYLLCPEATTNPVHRRAIAAPHETALTNLFSGRPARGIVNRLMRELGALRSDVPAFPTAAAAIAPLRAAAEASGSGDFSPLWCGQDAGGCRAVPAVAITRALARGIPG